MLMGMKNKRHHNQPKAHLGVDIGRVLMCPTGDDGRADTSFLNAPEHRAMRVPATPFVYDILPQLVEHFEGRVWLVSKAGPRIQALSLKWLEHHDFYARTGIRQDRVRFCRKRHEKRDHALRLSLTHFIDDRVDVLQHLRGVVSRLVLFGKQSGEIPAWTQPAATWQQVPAALGLLAHDSAGVLQSDDGAEPVLDGREVEVAGGHIVCQPNAIG